MPCRLTYQALALLGASVDKRSAHRARGAGSSRAPATRPHGVDRRGPAFHVDRAARRGLRRRGGADRPRCRTRRPGGHLVAEHLALGGGLPGDPPRRRRGGAVEHPLHRHRSHRHLGPSRRAGAVRGGPLPGRRPGGRPGPGRAARVAARRAGAGRSRRRDLGRVHRHGCRGPGCRRSPCRRRRTPGRQRHPVHLRHHRPQQRRAVRAPAVAVGLGILGRQREDHQRRPLPVHQPVLPQLRLQGRHPGLPADRCHADPARDVRSAARAAGHRAPPHHRVAGPSDHLPEPAGSPGPQRLRPELAAVRGHRCGHRAGGAGGAHAVRT
ncbi:Uncharacterised protein [Mycobacterium tuberculosis]|nr:Uncharacterised protein [Mycobacterium tuberculosis]